MKGESKMKQHLIKNKRQFECGKKRKKGMPTAFISDGELFNSDCEPIDSDNSDIVCLHCLKKADPDMYFNLSMKSKGIIPLPYKPSPITDWKYLLPEKTYTEIQSELSKAFENDPLLNNDVNQEASFISFEDEVSLVRGFGNQWMIITEIDKRTESITDWIDLDAAINEINDLLGKSFDMEYIQSLLN